MTRFSALAFRYPFRRYQGMILDLVQNGDGADPVYHLVAPPGSGKTIVGLELIRRFGRPGCLLPQPPSSASGAKKSSYSAAMPPGSPGT